MNTQDLVSLGTQLVNDAQAQNITLRMFGGVAIYAQCSNIAENPRLQRPNADLDLIVSADAWTSIGAVITARGFTKQDETATEQHFVKDDVTVEISSTQFREDFKFDFSRRLALIPLTLPLADLLLLKLARIKFEQKEIQDATALLVDHRITNGGDEAEDINRVYLYELANKNYGLWKTIFDNTVTLEKIFDKYLDPEQAQLAWRRIELIQEVLDGKSHSFGWWAGRVITR